MSFSKDHRKGKVSSVNGRPKHSTFHSKPYTSSSSYRTKTYCSTAPKAPINSRKRTQYQRQRILIVGGGVHGLVLAILLQRLGIDYLILEKSCEHRMPSGIVLGSFAINLLEMLGLVDQVKAHATDVHRMKIWRENGTIQAEMDFSGAAARYSHNGVAIVGKVLYDILLAQVPRHKILFGCDGVNSVIRKLLYQEQTTRPSVEDCKPDKRTCNIIGVTRVLDNMTILDPDTQQDVFEMNYINTQVVLGQNAPFACWMAPLPKERRISWMITYHRLDDEPAQHPDELEPDSMDRPDVEQEDYYCPFGNGQLGELLDQSDPDHIYPVLNEKRSYDIWFNGRVVLGGDACHRLVPGAGQGALQAMLDACSLAPLIRHALVASGDATGAEQLENITIALNSYYRERNEIARSSVEGSTDLSRMMALHFAHEPANLIYMQDPSQPLVLSPSGQPILYMAPPNIDLEFDFFPEWLQRYAEGMSQLAAAASADHDHGEDGENSGDEIDGQLF
ncbi:hypothetical protein FBU30_008875 [Linnemannia zychae]|nr:hypothetical protein FBU30_008875 [Linnemannia zychae]